MKYIPHAAAISLAATQSMAGGLSDSIIEAPDLESAAVVAPTGSADWIVPVLIFGALAAIAISSGNGDDDAPAPGPAAPTTDAPTTDAPTAPTIPTGPTPG